MPGFKKLSAINSQLALIQDKSISAVSSRGAKSYSSGFTLIEILVAISIIAIISVAGLVIYTGAQKSARDGKRRQDIQAIVLAFETNKVAGSQTTYNALSDNQFSNGKIPSDTSVEKYCLAKNTLSNTAPARPASASDWTAGQACPGIAAGYKVASSSADANNDNGVNAQAWTVCAYLEQGAPNFFCQSNSQ